MNKTAKFSPEVRERAVRMVQEHRAEHPSLWAAVESMAPKIGCNPSTLLDWVKRDEVDTGKRDGISTADREHVKALEREIKELRRANEILKLASAFFAQAELDRRLKSFVDTHRAVYGIEPFCKVMQIAPSGYRRHAARQRDPTLCSQRTQRNRVLSPRIQSVWQSNFQVYLADKVYKQLNREGVAVARCTVERLMRRAVLGSDYKASGGARWCAPPSAIPRQPAHWTG